jgi:hypothetical protein
VNDYAFGPSELLLPALGDFTRLLRSNDLYTIDVPSCYHREPNLTLSEEMEMVRVALAVNEGMAHPDKACGAANLLERETVRNNKVNTLLAQFGFGRVPALLSEEAVIKKLDADLA